MTPYLHQPIELRWKENLTEYLIASEKIMFPGPEKG